MSGTPDPEVTSPFHAVGKIFPGEVSPVTVAPETLVSDALRIMVERRFSQLPVVEAGKTRGVFSYRSLARELIGQPGLRLDQLAVEDAMETIPTVTVEDSLYGALSLLEEHEALLLSSPKGLQAILTPTDVLNYLFRVARPFVLLGEIELAVRALIQGQTAPEALAECAVRALASRYPAPRKPPAELADMTFDEQIALVVNKENWELFRGPLGQNRDLVRRKLERVRDIRNIAFHFRHELTVLDYEHLVATREWILDKARHAAARPAGYTNG